MDCLNESPELASTKFNEAYRLFELQSSEPNVTFFHVSLKVLRATRHYPELHTRRKELLRYLQKLVSALRNSSGGCVLVHLCDKKDTSLNISAFDEFADAGLKRLICDNSLYTDAYSRRWLSEDKQFEEYGDIIVLTASKCKGVSTVEHNTKVGSDHEIVEPQFFELISLLTSTNKDSSAKAELCKISYEKLYESRSVELKAFPRDQLDLLKSDKVSDLAEFIWKNLRFREYLNSISKVPSGGSYYVGIAEAKTSERASVDGIPFGGSNELKKKLKDELRRKLDTVCILKGRDCLMQSGKEVENLINIEIHDLDKSMNAVLEIAVRFVSGILFYDHGPVAYQIDEEKKIVKIAPDDWGKRFKCPVQRVQLH